MSRKIKILVACEWSGTVRDAFNSIKGVEAWSCDILPTAKQGKHIQGNVLNYLNEGWDCMIAHPPCTYITKAGATLMYKKKGVIDKERLKKNREAVDFFMKLYNAPIKHIAIENPTPLKISNLPKYNQVIQPYEFGEKWSKRTLLWLKELPALLPTVYNYNYTSYMKYASKKKRTKFFNGIAQAMAHQWSDFLKKEVNSLVL